MPLLSYLGRDEAYGTLTVFHFPVPYEIAIGTEYA